MSGPTSTRVSLRRRILDATPEQFDRHGIRAVGADTLIARSGVGPR
jgi:AcrR family transcriptional regulator